MTLLFLVAIFCSVGSVIVTLTELRHRRDALDFRQAEVERREAEVARRERQAVKLERHAEEVVYVWRDPFGRSRHPARA